MRKPITRVLTEEQLAALDAQAATVDLKALEYPFLDKPEDAVKWAIAFHEDTERWAAEWADAIKCRSAEVGLRCPWPRSVIARAIEKTMEGLWCSR